ncbi:MAG: hypothetical protein Q8R36_03910 [bacterium]|nr:hypothetical protein [bacterium]
MGIPVITLKNDEASVVAGLRGAIVFHNQEIESREKERNICQKKLDDILHQVALQGNAGYRDWSERHCGSKAAHSYKLEPTLSEDGKFVVLVERWKKE